MDRLFSANDGELLTLGISAASVPAVRADIERLRAGVTAQPNDFWRAPSRPSLVTGAAPAPTAAQMHLK